MLVVDAAQSTPLTGERNFSIIPESQEVAMGKEAAVSVAQSIGLYDDAKAQKYVADLGKRLAAASERPNLPWSFQVVDDPVVNAFALPGGFIFVTRGLMTHLGSEAQLAAVMGHEIGHVTGRHSVRMMSKATVAQLGLGVGMVFSETLRNVGQLGMAGMQLLFLKYGRDAEREADDLGFRYSRGEQVRRALHAGRVHHAQAGRRGQRARAGCPTGCLPTLRPTNGSSASTS